MSHARRNTPTHLTILTACTLASLVSQELPGQADDRSPNASPDAKTTLGGREKSSGSAQRPKTAIAPPEPSCPQVDSARVRAASTVIKGSAPAAQPTQVNSAPVPAAATPVPAATPANRSAPVQQLIPCPDRSSPTVTYIRPTNDGQDRWIAKPSQPETITNCQGSAARCSAPESGKPTAIQPPMPAGTAPDSPGTAANPAIVQTPSPSQPASSSTAPNPAVSNSTTQPVVGQSPATSPVPPSPVPPSPAPTSPLLTRQPILPTADQLRQGEVVTTLRYRQSFPSGSARDVGLTGQPTLGVSVGVTNGLELTLDAQTVDNSGPGQQGEFRVQRINPAGGGPNFLNEVALQAKQRLWQNDSGTLALSGVAGVSLGLASRPFAFNSPTGTRSGGTNDGLVPSLEFPFTARPNDRWQITVSPKVAFFPSDHALYFSNLNGSVPGSFGTTFGLAGGVSYRINPRLTVWGDAFVPFTGNNTINRDTGQPAKTVTFNAGLRYLVNPRLALDVFASNALGNTGALSIVGDRNFPSVGLGVTYMPAITGANRVYPDSFRSTQQPPPVIPSGFAPLLSSTLPARQLELSAHGGGQGFLSSLRYGLMDDLEVGAFVDSIAGRVDESELGISGKLRFLHQPDGDPFTLSGLVTVSRSNNVLLNLVNGDRNALQKQGLEKGGFVFSNEADGELLIVTLSAPMQYQFKGGSAIWLTPTLGLVQRSGVEVAGVSMGGSVPLTPAKDLRAIAEFGVDFSGRGNAFLGDSRKTAIPWIAGLRWQPASFLGLKGVQFDAYVTNRVGDSPFHSLRVRADNNPTFGLGVNIPIRF